MAAGWMQGLVLELRAEGEWGGCKHWWLGCSTSGERASLGTPCPCRGADHGIIYFALLAESSQPGKAEPPALCASLSNHRLHPQQEKLCSGEKWEIMG